MSDVFEELAQEIDNGSEPQEEEKPFSEIYNEFKQFLKSSFNKYGITKLDWTDPITKVEFHLHDDKVEFLYKGNDAMQLFESNLASWRIFVNDVFFLISRVVSNQKFKKGKKRSINSKTV